MFLILSIVDYVSATEIALPEIRLDIPISVRAQRGHRWHEGAYEVWHIRGGVEISQAQFLAKAREAVLWIDRPPPETNEPRKLIVYLEGDTVVDHSHGVSAHSATGRAAETMVGRSWQGRLHTSRSIQVVVDLSGPKPQATALVVSRARKVLGFEDLTVAQAQFATDDRLPIPPPTPRFDSSPAPIEVAPPSFPPVAPRGTEAAPAAPPLPPQPRVQARSLIVQSRGGSNLQVSGTNSQDRNETVITFTGGVSVLVEGIENVDQLAGDRVDLEADRLVVWTANLGSLSFPGQTQLSAETPLEFYLEGNIVFRDADRVIYANRMYYNVNRAYGVILNAEVLTPIPEYQGLLRLKADVLQQLDRTNFQAYGGAVTSSRLGVPRYWFQSENIRLQDFQQQVFNAQTGASETKHDVRASARNNFVYLAGIPIAYWPIFSTDATKPTFYLDRIRVRNDNVFGTQALLDWDLYQILGIQGAPENTKWGLSTDYLSDRGLGLGTNFSYNRESDLFGPGRYIGFLDAWGINEEGLDNLGADRRAVPPEEDLRGRILAQHRHYFSDGYQLTAELGAISDRNFLEQYYEREWDQEKDLTSGLEFKRYDGHSSWSISADGQLNDFFTQTEWLPRFDHTLIGQSFLFDRATWHAHSNVGYAHLRIAEPPANAVDLAKFDPLAWERDAEGIRAATRHELDLPLDLGPFRITPYVLGEAAHWGEDLTGNELTRFYGQAGVRGSIPFLSVDPTIQSALFNLNGLAHKVTLEADFSWADADRQLDQLPLYDALDDDATEHFRRRFFFDTFAGVAGGNVPLKFDERFYALRSGMQNWVTAPSTEIADDLMQARLGLHQRWQTKRGAPGRERIVDWIVLDIDGTVFPKPGRDNFGQEAGLVDYDFRWHVGDRLTLLSDGYADFFADGLRTISVGGALGRPERGTVYLGVRSIEGPISSNIITASANYRMTEKWIFSGSTSLDLGPTGNIGQTLALTRIGESALVRIGFNIDESRDNLGINFSIEPRFLPSSRLGYVGGVQIPPAGAYGLE